MEIESYRKHSLGHRAFLRFFFKKMKWPIYFLLITLVAWYSQQWVPEEYLPWGAYFLELLVVFTAAVFVATLLFAFLEYRVYTYTFTEEAFIMTMGLAMRTEVAALYHQIQNVNINRSPLDRMMGVSQIIIIMTGTGHVSEHNKIVLPAVGQRKAKAVQKELLIRARKHVPQAQPVAQV